MKPILNIVSTTVIVSMVLVFGYMGLEPIMVSAATSNVIVTLNVTTGISISNPPNATMSTNLGAGTSQAIATTTWAVATNNYLGYTMSIQAASSSAMQASSTATIPDWYNTSLPVVWNASSTAAFGYSVISTSTTDVASATWGSQTNCGATSTPAASLKYRGFTTSPYTIATRA